MSGGGVPSRCLRGGRGHRVEQSDADQSTVSVRVPRNCRTLRAILSSGSWRWPGEATEANRHMDSPHAGVCSRGATFVRCTAPTRICRYKAFWLPMLATEKPGRSSLLSTVAARLLWPGERVGYKLSVSQ